MTGMALPNQSPAARRPRRFQLRRYVPARRVAAIALISVAPVLGGCGQDHRGAPVGSVAADDRAELRREQDCASAQWKEANPSLYYNLCPHNPFR